MIKPLKKIQLFAGRNASTILSCVGGAGVIATSIMAAKATPKAMQLLEKAKEEKGEDLTKLEKIKVAAPSYIPAMLVGTSTIACIFGASVLNKRSQAGLMSAYALLDRSYKDYRNKVKELYGEEVDKHVVKEIVKDTYVEGEVTVEENKQLFYDYYSKRYFESTTEKVQQAEYAFNRLLNIRDYASLNEFYELLGLEKIDDGDWLGWSTGMNMEYYWQHWVDFEHEKVVMEDGLECIIISMWMEPTTEWQEY